MAEQRMPSLTPRQYFLASMVMARGDCSPSPSNGGLNISTNSGLLKHFPLTLHLSALTRFSMGVKKYAQCDKSGPVAIGSACSSKSSSATITTRQVQ